MLKFAICAGICYEWVYGPEIFSPQSLGSAAVRALLVALVAWMVLEALQALWLSIMSLDDRPPRRIDPRPTVIGK
jgi:di/tricarboxylate transporter